MFSALLGRRWQQQRRRAHTTLLQCLFGYSSSPPNLETNVSSPQRRSSKLSSSHQQVRQSFIDYFVGHSNYQHTFVRSSPVKPPPGDTSLLFTNAGMNQFKPIFLAETEDQIPPHLRGLKRAVNSQKCIRVGGKHCDLEAVGVDNTHHTFFEMLGNWSFNDYFKKEACQMAWTLLTEVYRIDPSRLVVTIFGGDASLGLPADLETFEIWRQIGVPAHRIVPLGSADNFWEMGDSGPCGICTELHYQLHPIDVSPGDQSYVKELEKSSYELWNIVFMQYYKSVETTAKDGQTLVRLPKNFVDTGAGLERLLALLQGFPGDNYRTDLFTPYFETIQRRTRWPAYSGKLDDRRDTAYRILADHARMAAVAIADGVDADDRGAGYLLRRVLRRAVNAIREVNDVNSKTLPEGVTEASLLVELASSVAVNSLGEAFPELTEARRKIATVVEEEVALYSTAQLRNSPTIVRLGSALGFQLANSNSEENSRAMFEKIEQIAAQVEALRAEVEGELKVNQTAVEKTRREFGYLVELMSEAEQMDGFGRRFGLVSEEIRKRLDQLELELVSLESAVDQIHEQVIAQFEAEARRKIDNFTSENFSFLAISNDCISGRSMDFFLLKVAVDLFGSERPLAVLLRQITAGEGEVESFIVQLTVPAHLQEDDQFPSAQGWFEEAVKLINQDDQPKLAIFPLKSRKVKRQVRYRVKLEVEEKTMFKWKVAEEVIRRALQEVVGNKKV